MNNTPDSPAKTPDDRTHQGGNYWTLFTPGIWKVLHAVLQVCTPPARRLGQRVVEDVRDFGPIRIMEPLFSKPVEATAFRNKAIKDSFENMNLPCRAVQEASGRKASKTLVIENAQAALQPFKSHWQPM